MVHEEHPGKGHPCSFPCKVVIVNHIARLVCNLYEQTVDALTRTVGEFYPPPVGKDSGIKGIVDFDTL